MIVDPKDDGRLMKEQTRELVAKIDVGMEREGCVLIYRQDSSTIELVTTSRDDGDCSLSLSREEAEKVGKCILEASAQTK